MQVAVSSYRFPRHEEFYTLTINWSHTSSIEITAFSFLNLQGFIVILILVLYETVMTHVTTAARGSYRDRIENDRYFFNCQIVKLSNAQYD